jgi:hypothetical protein
MSGIAGFASTSTIPVSIIGALVIAGEALSTGYDVVVDGPRPEDLVSRPAFLDVELE